MIVIRAHVIKFVTLTIEIASDSIDEGSANETNFKQRYHKMQHKMYKPFDYLNSNFSFNVGWFVNDIHKCQLPTAKTNKGDTLLVSRQIRSHDLGSDRLRSQRTVCFETPV